MHASGFCGSNVHSEVVTHPSTGLAHVSDVVTPVSVRVTREFIERVDDETPVCWSILVISILESVSPLPETVTEPYGELLVIEGEPPLRPIETSEAIPIVTLLNRMACAPFRNPLFTAREDVKPSGAVVSVGIPRLLILALAEEVLVLLVGAQRDPS